jgi:hypothetical protein
MPQLRQVPPAEQTPAVNALNVVHEAPAATQRPMFPEVGSSEQHAPVVVHLLFAQHGLPVTPQGMQFGWMSLVRSQTFVPLHAGFGPGQHGSLASPQCTQPVG